MMTRWFVNFRSEKYGRIVAGVYSPKTNEGVEVMFAGNPYGSHNLILTEMAGDGVFEAVRHGNASVINWSWTYGGRKLYRKVVKFLYKRNQIDLLKSIVPA